MQKNTSYILKIAFTIAIYFCSFFAKAQTTDSVRIAINNILAPLNKTMIPTGILAENTYPLLDLSIYNGQLSADNTIDFSQWRLLYNQALSGAYVAPVGLPDIAQLNTDYSTASNNGADNVVSISLISYASIRPTAITDGFIYVANGQLHDGGFPEAKTNAENRPSKGPYRTNRLFISAAANNTALNGILNLLFKPSLFYTNTGLTITNMEVDFGNGNGFINASFNTPLSATYTAIGNKQLIYKITFSDGSVSHCYNTVYVPYIPSSTSASRYAGAPTNANGADIPDVVLESPTNVHSGVDLFIRRSITNTAGSNTNPQFRKPLIIVEGLDLSSATTLLGNGYNYNAFRDEIRDGFRTSFTSGSNPFQPFDQYLDDVAGYDLIFVNWHNGVDDILRNVLALRDVINYVNAHKQIVADQNVILGISMGGLVSRYCLAQMVKSGGTGINEHQTRLLITHDSPHRGANVPLALQHLLQGLRKQRVKAFLGIYNKRLDEIVPQLLDVNTALNSPAPTQQLLARVIDENGTVAYNTFLDGDYRNMVNFIGTGFTQPYRFVATSNGSQCGVPLAAPYSPLASLDADGFAFIFGLTLWTKGRMYLDMRRLPDLGQTNRILDFNLKLKVKFLVFNLLKISMQIQQNAPGNLLPLDGLAGGTRNLGGATLSSTLSNIPPASGNANWLLFGYSYNYNTPYIAPSFSFVPTTSSLDVANFNAVNIPYSVPATGLNGSRAANFIAQESITLPTPIGLLNNVTHTDFYARTCNWLFNEMENIIQPVTCADFCSVDISGPVSFCDNATYTFPLPAGSSVTWSVTNIVPAGSVTFQIIGNTITLTRVQNGQATITANVTSGCFGLPITVSKNVIFGGSYSGYFTTSLSNTPVPILVGGSTHTIYPRRGQFVSIYIQLANLQNISNLHWYANNNSSTGTGSSFTLSATASIYSYSNTYISALLTGNSPCGDISSIYGFNLQTLTARDANNADSLSSQPFTATPNPVHDILNISVLNSEKKKVIIGGEYVIKISELNMLLPIKQLRINKTGKNFQINMAGLKTGYYAVEINDGQSIQVLKVFKL